MAQQTELEPTKLTLVFSPLPFLHLRSQRHISRHSKLLLQCRRGAWILLNEKKGHRVMPDYDTVRGNTR